MTDDELNLLLSQGELTPYPGVWQKPPFAERTIGDARYAVVAIDAGLSVLGVRRGDGSVWGLPDHGEPFLVNSSAEAFADFTQAYLQAAEEAEAYTGSDDEDDEEYDGTDEAADALTEALLARFAARDAEAVADENSFWHVAAEELGYGMNV